MKFKSFLLGLLVGVFAISSPVLAAENSSIRVTGQGRVSLKPDRCKVEFKVISRDKDQKKALLDNNLRSQALVKAFMEAGIGEEDIETSNISIRPVINYEKSEKIEGYLVTNSLGINIKDITSIGKYIDLGVKNGGDFAGNLVYSSTRASEGYNEALKKAIFDARKKTEVIATSLGVKLKSVTRVEELSRNYYDSNIVNYDLAKEESISSSQLPEIIVGDIIIEASINLESNY